MLRLENIEKNYGEKKVLQDINLTLESGEIFGLIGEEGAGKTTLFRIIAGLLKPDQGSVWLQGEKLHERSRRAKLEMSYVPSSIRMYDRLKVREHMEFFAGFYPLEGLKKDRWIEEILSQMNLLHKADTYVEELSQGMKRRLCLAQALLPDPEILILDETGNGLDSRTRQELKEILKKLSQSKRTILISSHNISELPDYCTSLGILEQGKMILQGNMTEMLGEIKMRQPILLQILEGQEQALALLKREERVKRITILDGELRIEFDGEKKEEAKLLRRLLEEGVEVCGFSRDDENFEHSVMHIISKQGE